MNPDDEAGDQTELVERSHLNGQVERVWLDERSSDWRDLSDHHLRRLGIPVDAEFHRLVLQGTGARLGWVVWLWGVPTNDPHEGPQGRRLFHKVVTSTGEELWVRAVRIEVGRCSGTYHEFDFQREAPSVIVEWPEAGLSPGQVSVCGLPFTGSKLPSIRDVRPAFEILASIGRGGSPAGPRKGQVWTRQGCLEWHDAWKLDRDPTLGDLAEAMELTDPETAANRWRSTGLSWPPQRREIEQFWSE